MESSDSDEEYYEMGFWNNWDPNQKRKKLDEKSVRNMTKHVVFNTRKRISISSYKRKSKFKNWIPPITFLYDSKPNSKPNSNFKKPEEETQKEISTPSVSSEPQEISQKVNIISQSIISRKGINQDWGERVQLHDVTKFTDGDTFWGVVNLGVFATIKLWVNEYGNICGSADGKITKPTSTELSYISITNLQLLRKMLGLSSAQWSSLCETVQESKSCLKFDAFENFDFTNKNHLDKLWFFTCKRRHFLPHQCMLVKLSGAVKCMRKFQIIPKLIVLDIRNLKEEPIS